jgi:RNA polymerase sigma-70 factor, ECF subfamily
MTRACTARELLAPLRGLRFAADGPKASTSPSPISLLASVNQPKHSRESLVIDLYDELRPSLLVHLGGLGLNLHESEDVIHDSFLRLFDHLARRQEDQNLRGWLFRVAHNLAMDVFRDGQRVQLPDDEEADPFERMVDAAPNPEQQTIRNQEVSRLRVALKALTQQQRSAVLLRAEELRYREIAAILGVSTKRVSELVHRALVRLAGEL